MKFRKLPVLLLIATLLCAYEAPLPTSLPLNDLPIDGVTQAPAAAQEKPFDRAGLPTAREN